MDDVEQDRLEEPSPDDGDGASRRTMSHGTPFGCTAAFSFACIAGVVILVGTFMGDCPDGSCHPHDKSLLVRELGLVGAAALALGFCVRMAVNLAWPKMVGTGDLAGASCLVFGIAIMIGLVAGGYWIDVMIAFGI